MQSRTVTQWGTSVCRAQKTYLQANLGSIGVNIHPHCVFKVLIHTHTLILALNVYPPRGVHPQ